MNPVKFKGQNVIYAESQPENLPLPALKINSPRGEVVSCWALSFKERVKILFTGKLWVSLMCFNKPLTPSYFSVNRKEVFSLPEDKK